MINNCGKVSVVVEPKKNNVVVVNSCNKNNKVLVNACGVDKENKIYNIPLDSSVTEGTISPTNLHILISNKENGIIHRNYVYKLSYIDEENNLRYYSSVNTKDGNTKLIEVKTDTGKWKVYDSDISSSNLIMLDYRSDFPEVGEIDKLYFAINEKALYSWDNTKNKYSLICESLEDKELIIYGGNA